MLIIIENYRYQKHRAGGTTQISCS